MTDMTRKIRRGAYQIGIYEVRKHKGAWVSEAVTGPWQTHKSFPSLAAAHLALTGEAMRNPNVTPRPDHLRRR